MTTVRQALTNCNPNSLPGACQEVNLGQALATINRTRRAAVTSDKMVLPENAKAATLLSVYVTGTLNGYLTPLAPGSNATPTTGQVSINGAGDITFAAADAVAFAEIIYTPFQGDYIFEEDLDVAASGVANAVLLNAGRRALVLLSATSLTGTLTGVLTPVKRSSTQPTTGLASIGGTATVDSTKIWFATADAVTRARVRYLALPGVGTSTGRTTGEALAADTQLT